MGIRERIYFSIYDLYDNSILNKNEVVSKKTDQLLAIIKEEGYLLLPEDDREEYLYDWATTNGYVKPPESMELTELTEELYNFRETMGIEEIKANIQSFLLGNHYVKLADDQSLPSVYEIQRTFTGFGWTTCENLQRWLSQILAGWRKGEMGVKDGS